jgi:hypothetical protein
MVSIDMVWCVQTSPSGGFTLKYLVPNTVEEQEPLRADIGKIKALISAGAGVGSLVINKGDRGFLRPRP